MINLHSNHIVSSTDRTIKSQRNERVIQQGAQMQQGKQLAAGKQHTVHAAGPGIAATVHHTAEAEQDTVDHDTEVGKAAEVLRGMPADTVDSQAGLVEGRVAVGVGSKGPDAGREGVEAEGNTLHTGEVQMLQEAYVKGVAAGTAVALLMTCRPV